MYSILCVLFSAFCTRCIAKVLRISSRFMLYIMLSRVGLDSWLGLVDARIFPYNALVYPHFSYFL